MKNLRQFVLACSLAFASLTATAAVLQQISTFPTDYVEGVDFRPMLWSGVGDVTANVTPVDLDLGLGNASTSGCEATDFAGFTVGNIALIQRGACTFNLKAQNAKNAGAAGVLIFNQGNTVSREGLFEGSLGSLVDIPTFSLPYTLGAPLSAIDGLAMRMQVDLDDPIRPAPAPATIALLGVGLAGLGVARRRRAQ